MSSVYRCVVLRLISQQWERMRTREWCSGWRPSAHSSPSVFSVMKDIFLVFINYFCSLYLSPTGTITPSSTDIQMSFSSHCFVFVCFASIFKHFLSQCQAQVLLGPTNNSGLTSYIVALNFQNQSWNPPFSLLPIWLHLSYMVKMMWRSLWKL